MRHTPTISITGLGIVGLTLATAFGKVGLVIGFDINKNRVDELKKGFDRNGEVSKKRLHDAEIIYTTNSHELNKANFHIISVPTPTGENHQPDFSYLKKASETLAKELKKGDIVVYESSVYPGATEEICIPILEKISHLKCGKDFGVGYSPERINPADKKHTLEKVPKIISANDKKSLDAIAKIYVRIIKGGLYKAESIKIAEAAKIVENIQRDVNISFVNEIAIILHNLGIDSKEVLKAAETKWNFLPFKPGLVGGHCVGINNYYLTHKSEEAGFHPELLSTSRRINENMTNYIVDNILHELAKIKVPKEKARIGILGITYKPNCKDPNDSKVIEIINTLKTHEITNLFIHDPLIKPAIAKEVLGLTLVDKKELHDLDILIIAVAHDPFCKMRVKTIEKMLKKNGAIIDIPGMITPKKFINSTLKIWQL